MDLKSIETPKELIPHTVTQALLEKIGNMSGIIEVSTACNLACDYCFAKRNNPSIMSVEMVEKIIEALLKYNGRGAETKFIWHGGEPLLAGISFYEAVLRKQKSLALDGYVFTNSIQTNGTLINDQWIDFFKENSFGVGSSLDGLPGLHDAKRRDRNNLPTYDNVVNNLMRAKEKGLTIGVICVIDKNTVPHVESIYKNLKSLGLPFTMSPVTPNHGQDLSAQPLSPDEYSDVLIRLFDVWFDDPNPTIQVNPPHSIIQGLIYGGLPLYCSVDDSCFSKFISFLPDGSVYPCNRFAGDNAFQLGNISEQSFEEALNSPKRKYLLSRTKESLEPCASCESNDLCRGGCAHHAYAFYGDIMKPDYYCKSFFKAFSYYSKRLANSLDEAEIQTQGG